MPKLKDIDDPSVHSLKSLLETVLQLRKDIQQMMEDIQSFQPAEFAGEARLEERQSPKLVLGSSNLPPVRH
jgi:hypothetical protein